LVKPASSNQLRATLEVAYGAFLRFVMEQRENADLRQRLEDRKVIEAAKWQMVSTKQVTEPQAINLMRQMARDTRRSLVAVANEVLGSSRASET
jgi:two-component system, response regulator PdtaR